MWDYLKCIEQINQVFNDVNESKEEKEKMLFIINLKVKDPNLLQLIDEYNKFVENIFGNLTHADEKMRKTILKELSIKFTYLLDNQYLFIPTTSNLIMAQA